jgi:hypothetical protein
LTKVFRLIHTDAAYQVAMPAGVAAIVLARSGVRTRSAPGSYRPARFSLF